MQDDILYEASQEKANRRYNSQVEKRVKEILDERKTKHVKLVREYPDTETMLEDIKPGTTIGEQLEELKEIAKRLESFGRILLKRSDSESKRFSPIPEPLYPINVDMDKVLNATDNKHSTIQLSKEDEPVYNEMVQFNDMACLINLLKEFPGLFNINNMKAKVNSLPRNIKERLMRNGYLPLPKPFSE